MTLEIEHETVEIEPIKVIKIKSKGISNSTVVYVTMNDDKNKIIIGHPRGMIMDMNYVTDVEYSIEEFDAFIAALQRLRDQVANG